jgi:hypothetical protein
MKKTEKQENLWPEKIVEEATPVEPVEQSKYQVEYDLEGLMTDFPTAKELERFVYDQTGIVLNLKGRANKLKYQIAMDVLNGQKVDDKFIGVDNPYLDKMDMIPEDPLPAKPERDPSLPSQEDIQNSFWSPVFPHPDPTERAMDKKVHVMFRKYNNGMISYEIMGPLEQRAHGEKIDKYGRARPEIIKWIDPRSGEQVCVREDGTLSPQGKKIRAMMQGSKFRVNNSNQWDVFVDRELASLLRQEISNPWDV